MFLLKKSLTTSDRLRTGLRHMLLLLGGTFDMLCSRWFIGLHIQKFQGTIKKRKERKGGGGSAYLFTT